jgi:aspartyl protease family protein
LIFSQYIAGICQFLAMPYPWPVHDGAQALEDAGMFERDEQWDLETLDVEPEGGVLLPVLRNVGALIAICLMAAGAFYAIIGDGDDLSPGAQEARVLPVPSTQILPIIEDGDRGGNRDDEGENAGAYELSIPAGANGHFLVDAMANGNSVRFLVDTGASGIMLTEADARSAGIQPASLTYSGRIETANGPIEAARTTVREIRIDNLVVDDVEVWITRAPLPISLLGMTFLKRMASYEAREDRLILRW